MSHATSSLSPPVAVPRPTLNSLPLLIALFCLLWSFAFVAGKIGVTYCPLRCAASAGRYRCGIRWRSP